MDHKRASVAFLRFRRASIAPYMRARLPLYASSLCRGVPGAEARYRRPVGRCKTNR